MGGLVSVPLVLWLAALVARPRRPLPNNEVEELVYSRLLGRHERLMLLALIATGLVFFAGVTTIPQHVERNIVPMNAERVCADDSALGPPSCVTRRADGTWQREVLRSGSGWQVVATGTVSTPPTMSNDAMRR